MGTEAREELKAKQLEKGIYFAANLVTFGDEEKRHEDLSNLEAEMLEELGEVERQSDIHIDKRFQALEDAAAKMEEEDAKDNEIRAKQKAAEKEIASLRERGDSEV